MTSEYEDEGTFSFLNFFDFLSLSFSGASDHTSPRESEDKKPRTADPDDEEAEVVDAKTPAKKSKRRPTRKSTAAAKEAKEAAALLQGGLPPSPWMECSMFSRMRPGTL